jgi:hypothetical protein
MYPSGDSLADSFIHTSPKNFFADDCAKLPSQLCRLQQGSEPPPEAENGSLRLVSRAKAIVAPKDQIDASGVLFPTAPVERDG